MKFEARLEESSLFRRIFVDTIKQFVKTVNIDITENGINFQAMDAIHIAMTFTSIDKSVFQHFHCKKPLTLGISLENLNTVLKMGSSNDTLALMCEDDDDDDPTQLRIRFQAKQGDRITEFNLDLIKINTQNYALPNLQYQTICSMPTTQYVRLCKQLFSISPTVRIQTSKQAMKFSIQSSIGSGSTTIRQTNSQKQKNSVILDVDEPLNQSYSANHLLMFVKGSGLSERITLHFSKQAPLMVMYSILDGKGFIKYFLAPRVQDDNQ